MAHFPLLTGNKTYRFWGNYSGEEREMRGESREGGKPRQARDLKSNNLFHLYWKNDKKKEQGVARSLKIAGLFTSSSSKAHRVRGGRGPE